MQPYTAGVLWSLPITFRTHPLRDVVAALNTAIHKAMSAGDVRRAISLRMCAPIITKLYAETTKVLETQAMKTRLDANSLEPLGLSPEASAQFIMTDTMRWARVIRDAGIAKE
ncbi:MAG: hypothetical protein V7640_2449 [Betaproteobacteria bacterium]|jgi:hypothetical protein